MRLGVERLRPAELEVVQTPEERRQARKRKRAGRYAREFASAYEDTETSAWAYRTALRWALHQEK